MLFTFLALLLFLTFPYTAYPQNDLLQFKIAYNNTNPIFFNPSSHGEWSIHSILINQTPYVDEIRSDIVEVNLQLYKPQPRDTLILTIRFNKNIGIPELVNQYEVLYAEHFSFVNATIDKKTEIISWEVDAFRLSGTFELEQYRWDEWITMAVVEAQNSPFQRIYSTQAYPHSGKNLFRVTYTDSLGNTFYSPDIKYTSKNPTVQLKSTKVKNIIEFSSPTYYQLFNESGTLISQGFEETINVGDLPKGKYFLRYDNTTVNIVKK